jgi:hypothetical protein
MLSSGMVKLLSGDEAWASLTAMQYHYETQPLPTWIGWWAHQLSPGLQTVSALAMFAVELVLPFALFLPRRIRHVAALSMVGLQILIALTGNYAFFNLLSAALCFLALDDGFFGVKGAEATISRWRAWATAAAAVFLIAVGAGRIPSLGLPKGPEWVSSWRLVNGYGLFSIMTRERREIVIEVKGATGQDWKEWPFRYKPGDIWRAPEFVAPHQPRLDWQMWFAVFGTYDRSPWLAELVRSIKEGRPSVLQLLGPSPLGGEPVTAVRTRVRRYRFTDFEERSQSGRWWEYQDLGEYGPTQ